MKYLFVIFGAWLLAAPSVLFPQDRRGQSSYLLEFTLEETEAQVIQKMGPPLQVADFGPNHRTWQFQIDIQDKHEFSHLLCFRQSDKKLVSITRNSQEAENVDALFPLSTTTAHHWPDSEKPQYSVRVRRLSGERTLVAMGSSKPGQPANQLILIRRAALEFFMPWLAPQVDKIRR